MTVAKVLITTSALMGFMISGVRDLRPAQSTLCWQPTVYTEATLAALRSYVSRTDARTAELRARVGLLQDSPDSVYVVSNEEVCHRGAVALAVLKGNPDTVNLHPVLTIKAGTMRYVLDDGATKGGEFMASYVADTSFRILGAIAN